MAWKPLKIYKSQWTAMITTVDEDVMIIQKIKSTITKVQVDPNMQSDTIRAWQESKLREQVYEHHLRSKEKTNKIMSWKRTKSIQINTQGDLQKIEIDRDPKMTKNGGRNGPPTTRCGCQNIKSVLRVLGMYNFELELHLHRAYWMKRS